MLQEELDRMIRTLKAALDSERDDKVRKKLSASMASLEALREDYPISEYQRGRGRTR